MCQIAFLGALIPTNREGGWQGGKKLGYMDRLKDSVAGNTERAADLKTVEGIIYKHFGGSRFSRGSIMHDGD